MTRKKLNKIPFPWHSAKQHKHFFETLIYIYGDLFPTCFVVVGCDGWVVWSNVYPKIECQDEFPNFKDEQLRFYRRLCQSNKISALSAINKKRHFNSSFSMNTVKILRRWPCSRHTNCVCANVIDSLPYTVYTSLFV